MMQKSSKNCTLVRASILEAFQQVLGAVWETKNHDFRHFSAFFSKSNLKRGSDSKKIAKNEPTKWKLPNFGPGLRCTGGSWGEQKRGYKNRAWISEHRF